MSKNAISSSFRDRSGYVFLQDGKYVRSVNRIYRTQYDLLMGSGLYHALVANKQLIPHTEITAPNGDSSLYKMLLPEQLHTVSYAWEWSFSMLKDAALCTLDIALKALEHDMILKDANSYNMQFVDAKPILIDTLSFEHYHESESWIAYRQFCEHFLAPLVLMHYTEGSLNKLLLAYPDGIPLSLCKQLLPLRARWNIHVYLHILLQSKLAGNASQGKAGSSFSRQKMQTLLKGLRSFVQSLQRKKEQTTWANYYNETISGDGYLAAKKELIAEFLSAHPFDTLLDLGANDGEFTLLALAYGKRVVALDEDRNCIDKLYNHCKLHNISNVLPLICNLAHPSPAIGWANEERPALFQRIGSDITMALALIHHLAIGHNIPLKKIIAFLHTFSPRLIIEFVPKEDEKVKQLLAHREDVFDDYHPEAFKQYLMPSFEIIYEEVIPGTFRTLFYLKRI